MTTKKDDEIVTAFEAEKAKCNEIATMFTPTEKDDEIVTAFELKGKCPVCAAKKYEQTWPGTEKAPKKLCFNVKSHKDRAGGVDAQSGCEYPFERKGDDFHSRYEYQGECKTCYGSKYLITNLLTKDAPISRCAEMYQDNRLLFLSCETYSYSPSITVRQQRLVSGMGPGRDDTIPTIRTSKEGFNTTRVISPAPGTCGCTVRCSHKNRAR